MANTLKLGAGKWATGTDTVLAFNDENNNFKPLPFDFSRASSATVVNQSGLIETVGSGEPRIDFKDNTKGALLLEPSRTNSLLQSNQFDTTWSTVNATITNGKIGVGGSVNAWKLDSTGTASRLIQTISTSGQKAYSIYAKIGTLNFIRIFVRETSDDNQSVYFNLLNGTISSQSSNIDNASIKSVGNGWYRCSMVFTESISDIRIYPAQADGDLSQTSGNIYIQYAQLEEGSYATSYIPTSGQSGGVTRVLDSCTNGANNQVINSTEGVLYAEIKPFTHIGDPRISLSDGGNNKVVFSFINSNQVRMLVFNGSVQAERYQNITYNTINKLAISYKLNEFKFVINGVIVSTDTSGNTPTSMNKLNLSNSTGSSTFQGKTNDLRVFTTALTDSELIALTTI